MRWKKEKSDVYLPHDIKAIPHLQSEEGIKPQRQPFLDKSLPGKVLSCLVSWLSHLRSIDTKTF